ncbi:hypothetical protein Pmani_039818, partial [Petrolisthes manimaculis]
PQPSTVATGHHRDDYEIAYTQNIADDLKEMDQLKNLHQKDVRVILGYFDEHWARRIFCEAYRKGMYGKNYQWIITGMYRESWWDLPGNEEETVAEVDFEDEPQESGGGGCAVEDIMTALEGCIMTDLLPLATSLTRTVSGRSPSQTTDQLIRSSEAVLLLEFVWSIGWCGCGSGRQLF